jgi:hypothetical protein
MISSSFWDDSPNGCYDLKIDPPLCIAYGSWVQQQYTTAIWSALCQCLSMTINYSGSLLSHLWSPVLVCGWDGKRWFRCGSGSISGVCVHAPPTGPLWPQLLPSPRSLKDTPYWPTGNTHRVNITHRYCILHTHTHILQYTHTHAQILTIA